MGVRGAYTNRRSYKKNQIVIKNLFFLFEHVRDVEKKISLQTQYIVCFILLNKTFLFFCKKWVNFFFSSKWVFNSVNVFKSVFSNQTKTFDIFSEDFRWSIVYIYWLSKHLNMRKILQVFRLVCEITFSLKDKGY